MTRPVRSTALAACATFFASTAIAAEPSSNQVPSFTPQLPNFQGSPNLSNLNQADYVLGPGDQLQLTMYGQTDLFGASGYSVLVDGTVSLPFIGRVPVAGRTVREVEVDVTNMYKRYFKRPYVTVVLAKPRQLTLAVSGEVVKPGTYPFVGTDQIPTVSQLLKLSGGVTPSADLRNIQVRRSTSFYQPQSYQTISINLMKLIRDGDISQDIRLRDSDIVVVPAAARPSLDDFSAAVNSSFASDNTQPLKIAVIGEVFRPGPYTVQAGNAVIGEAGTQGAATSANTKNLPTVSQAVQIAGGIRPEADVRKIQVRRISRAGTEQILSVDLWKLLVEGDIRQDIPLQEGDTVIIAKATAPLTREEQQFLANATLSPATIDVNVVGEVIRPGTVKIKPNTPLNTAVLAAGGFDTRRANSNSVKLLRLNPDGTVTERKIKIAFNAPVDEEKNPALRNNDVVIVGKSGLAKFSDATSQIFAPITSTTGFIQSLILGF